jgi:hypothetical protein
MSRVYQGRLKVVRDKTNEKAEEPTISARFGDRIEIHYIGEKKHIRVI